MLVGVHQTSPLAQGLAASAAKTAHSGRLEASKPRVSGVHEAVHAVITPPKRTGTSNMAQTCARPTSGQ